MFFRLLLVTVFCAVSTVHLTSQIISIASFKTRNINDTLQAGELIAGRVTVANQFRNTCFIQDATGGIAIFNTQFRNGVAVGDSVHILSGQYQEFQATTGQPGTGLGQITGARFSFIVIPNTRVEQSPRTASIPSVGESLEAVLIRLRNVTFRQSGAFQGDNNYTVLNANGDSIQVRIDANTNIALSSVAIPTGTIDLVGVVSQFRGTYQVQPRFASDLGLTINLDTVNKNRTLDITTWNLLWFAHEDIPTDSAGPINKQLQFDRIKQSLDSLGSDIYAFQEIANITRFQHLRDSINGQYENLVATFSQPQKTGYLISLPTVRIVESGSAVNGGSQAWANGRFPLRMTVNATIGNSTRKIIIFNIHAKATGAGTEQDDWRRRLDDATTFHSYLRDFYPNDAVVVLGDFNDNITTSIVGANTTPYSVFVNDAPNWKVVTKPLEEFGINSYIGFNRSMLDHIIVSNELFNAIHNTRVEGINGFISSYTSTVSDHLPVTLRVMLDSIDQVTTVDDIDTDLSASIKIAPNPAQSFLNLEIDNKTLGNVKISVVNLLGVVEQTVFDGMLPAQIQPLSINTNELSSGMYILVLEKDGIKTVKQFTVVK